MSLRRRLLAFYLLLLTLPVVGWQSVRQVETFLRDAQGQALLAQATTLAGLVTEGVSTEPGGIYVNELPQPLQIDGYADDWQPWRDYAQVVDGTRDRFSLRLQAAAWQRELYLLVEVRDATSRPAAETAGRYQDGDHLQLRLLDGRGFGDYRIVPSVPGEITVLPVGAAGAGAGPNLRGRWRSTEDGYRVELALPRSLTGQDLKLTVLDTGDQPTGPQSLSLAPDGQAVPLIWPQEQRLAPVAVALAPRERVWLLNREGWVLGRRGELPPDDAQSAGGWQRLAYRLLTGSAVKAAAPRVAPFALALDGPEIRAARQGQAQVSWRRVSANRVEGSAAVPLKNAAGILVLERRGDPLLLATNRSALRLLGLTVAVVAVVFIGLLAYTTVLSLRIRRLRDAVEAGSFANPTVAADERSDDALLLPGEHASDEIGDLTRSFGGLYRELNTYNQYLKTLAGKLSHELNTPLAVVRSSLDNLRHEPLGEEAQAFADRADSGAARLQQILRAMSAANRLEQTVKSAERIEFDLVEVIEGCVAGYRSLSPQPAFETHLPARAPAQGAPELLAQMLDKLVDNARDFCPADGSIRLTLEAVRGGWRLTVANDGPLLPDHLKGQIFESLVSARAEDSAATHLGLGLHIVRIIARAHGGRVQARNLSDGSGVEFLVWLKA
ncbi:MAG: ATP-binding protein [Pseudomonadota bacterium]